MHRCPPDRADCEDQAGALLGRGGAFAGVTEVCPPGEDTRVVDRERGALEGAPADPGVGAVAS